MTKNESRVRSALIYTRVSTLEQATNGISLPGQEADLRAYAEVNGLRVAEVIVDGGVSGATPLSDRPGGRRMLDALEAGEARTVIAWRLDRLFRSAPDALGTIGAWAERGVALRIRDLGGQECDTGSASGKLVLSLLAVLAEFERDTLRERVRAAMRTKRARSEFCGGHTPYGYRIGADGKTLEPIEDELETVRLVKDLRSIHGLSFRGICRRLTEKGIQPRSGGAWYASSIRRMLGAAV